MNDLCALSSYYLNNNIDPYISHYSAQNKANHRQTIERFKKIDSKKGSLAKRITNYINYNTIKNANVTYSCLQVLSIGITVVQIQFGLKIFKRTFICLSIVLPKLLETILRTLSHLAATDKAEQLLNDNLRRNIIAHLNLEIRLVSKLRKILTCLSLAWTSICFIKLDFKSFIDDIVERSFRGVSDVEGFVVIGYLLLRIYKDGGFVDLMHFCSGSLCLFEGIKVLQNW